MAKSRALKGSFYANMAILSAVLVSESLSATLMMPFVGLFVSHLQHVPPSEAGYMSGLLISVFQLGQVLTGKMWGTASDRVGRKPMIQMGLLANAIVSTFFGMSPNLTFCIIMRFIHGCANGNVLVAKTVIADITDKETEGMGFAAISIFWGVGSIVGPAIGGYLYDPVHHAVLGPWLFDGVTEESGNIFHVHPALLPCLVISVFSLLTLVIISWILPETSRHPVDPFLSLFTAPSSPVRNRAGAEAAAKASAGGASSPHVGVGGAGTAAGELVAVAEEIDDGDFFSDDEVDSQYGDADGLKGSLASPHVDHGSSNDTSNGGRPPLTKRLFSSTSTMPTSESLNKVIASALLAKEYDRRSGRSGPVAGAASHAVTGRGAEPRRRKHDDAPLSSGDKKAGSLHHSTTADDGTREKCAEDMKFATHPLRDDPTIGEDLSGDDERSAPMAFGYREAFQMPSARNVMIVYMCIASTESALLEIIPLWAISEREKGGLGFASADIGTLLCISSVVYVAVNVIFSRVLKCMGGATRPLWDFSVLLWCVTSILTPCCAYFTDEQTIFYSASLVTSIREIGLSWSYSILYMYVVRCAPDDCAGSINGIAQSIGSFSRMLTMLFIPPVFAWSLNGVTNPFPFNFHFVFWVTCLPLLVSFVMSSYLPVRVTG